jgi:H+/Cl- antiporter ClcA
MTPDHRNTSLLDAVRHDLSNWPLWAARAVVIGFAALSGLTVVALTWLTERAFSLFEQLHSVAAWAPLLWTPLCTAGIVWAMRRYAMGAAGSGIPQVMAAMDPSVAPEQRHLFVSLKLTLSKMAMTTTGLLGGLSLGREGPSVQIAAGVMHHARRYLPSTAPVSHNDLLMAGGAAGIAAAFNTPLGGIMFAIEELSRRPEQRNTGLLLAAIVLSGLMAVSVYGNATYFGVIRVDQLSLALVWPGLLVALACGVVGGLFARLLLVCVRGDSADAMSRWRQRAPVTFAATCGLVVAVIGLVSHGSTFGTGYTHSRSLLEGGGEATPLYTLLKFLATWITAWSGVPGGIFAPALSIGGSLGNDVAQLTHYANAPTLIALGMAGFLAAVTQAPLTAFIIVMEMVDGHALVLSLMATALVASGVSRLLSAPLYQAMAKLQLQRLPPTTPNA